jgi:rhamnosyltransferase subunit B
MRHKIVLATMGSLGDLHPFIALGCALRDRGVNVVLACAVEYGSKVTAAGLQFHALRPSFADVERDLGMDRAELGRARAVGDSLAAEDGAAEGARIVLDRLERLGGK